MVADSKAVLCDGRDLYAHDESWFHRGFRNGFILFTPCNIIKRLELTWTIKVGPTHGEPSEKPWRESVECAIDVLSKLLTPETRLRSLHLDLCVRRLRLSDPVLEHLETQLRRVAVSISTSVKLVKLCPPMPKKERMAASARIAAALKHDEV